MRRTTSILPLLFAATMLAGPAYAAIHMVPGKRIVARSGGSERLVFVTTTPTLTVPARGGPDDPLLVGAVLQVINPTTQEFANLPLPAANWTVNGAGTTYRYRGRVGTVRSVLLRAGRRLRIQSRGVGITLDETAQGSLGLNLVSGAQQYCAVFGGSVLRDEPGRFVARGAPAPATCPSNVPACAVARVAADQNDIIEGPLSRGRLGDYLLANDLIQVTVQQNGRVWGFGPYGGNIIDADLQRPFGGERDSFEELLPGINLENTANYTDSMILNDGSDCQPAVIRFSGVDDLYDFVNGSSAIRDMGFMFPASADDRDLPVDVRTDYTLTTGQRWVRMDTTIVNTGLAPLPIYFAEYVNGSGQIEMWRPAYGFGEPLVTTSCPPASYLPCTAGLCDPCSFVAFTGEDLADGVSYGYVHGANGSTAVTVSGVTVPVLGQEAVTVFVTGLAPNFNLAPAGLPGDDVTLTRYFVVGDGSIGAIVDARNTIQGITTGTLRGTVTSGGSPVVDADVAVIATGAAGPAGLQRNVVDHFRTTADGTYSGTLPAGTYEVRANKDGRLAATPAAASVGVVAASTTTQDFTLPPAGLLRVLARDEAGAPIPAKVQLVGFDPSPDPLNTQDVLGQIENTTGIFGEQQQDGLEYGIAFVAFAGGDGSTGFHEVEPGSYQLVVSRGPRYSVFTQSVTITAGAMTDIAAQIARVIQTPGFITADFHVHALDSPDCEVTKEERIATEMAEGTDFFTPSEHEFRADFAPTIAAMGVGDLIATTPSSEITTFDYGHFNAWPVAADPMQINGGALDWGRPGPSPGTDFPSLGSYCLAPAEIYAAAHADTPGNLVQINHMKSHFDVTGLDIDTAMTPPQSFRPAADRRLDPMLSNLFEAGFDALEVWIGTDGRTGDLVHFVGENLGDWFNMLNQGIRRTGVADSDTHQRRTTQINARTYLASSVTAPAALPGQALTLAANVKDGRASGTNAPFVTVTASAPSTGQTAGLGMGQATMLATSNGMVDVTVTVRSPLWAEFDRIQLFVNNAPQPFDHDGDGATRNRYRVIPNFEHVAGTDFTVTTVTDFPLISGAGHLEATTTFPLTGLAADAWFVVLVRGTDGVSRPLFPVYPNSLRQTGNTTLANLTDGNLGEDGVVALAFTNPLLIDANNDSVWTPPGVMLTPP